MKVRVRQNPKDGWFFVETQEGWFGNWKYYACRVTREEAMKVATLLKHPDIKEID